MKGAILLVMMSLALASNAAAGTLDPRFDGKWVGVEAIEGYFVHFQLGGGQNPGHIPAMIAIADSGGTFGVVKGLTPGRYDVSPKSEGNTLAFKLGKLHSKGSVFFGRTDGKLVLSADGNTLTEKSYAILPGRPHSANCVITGSFHRIGK
jgi:hypothetical protein